MGCSLSSLTNSGTNPLSAKPETGGIMSIGKAVLEKSDKFGSNEYE